MNHAQMQRMRHCTGGYKTALIEADPSSCLHPHQAVPTQQKNSQTRQSSGVSLRDRSVSLSDMLHQQDKQGIF